MSNSQTPCANHEHHLCQLTGKGLHKSDPKMYHALVQNPAFVCKSCGRVAAKKDNLCSPVKLGTWDE
jgi:hypothetical protein